MSIVVLEDGTLKFDRWVKTSSMINSNRDCLDPDDPRQTYNYLRDAGIVPEEYGIRHPYETLFKGRSREDLMDEIIQLRKEMEGMAKWL